MKPQTDKEKLKWLRDNLEVYIDVLDILTRESKKSQEKYKRDNWKDMSVWVEGRISVFESVTEKLRRYMNYKV